MEKAVSRLIKISDDLERWDHQFRMMQLLVTPAAKARYAANLYRAHESLEGVLTRIAGTPIRPYQTSLFWNPIVEQAPYPPLEGLVALSFMENRPELAEEMDNCTSMADSLIAEIREACFALVTGTNELIVWDLLTNLIWDE